MLSVVGVWVNFSKYLCKTTQWYEETLFFSFKYSFIECFQNSRTCHRTKTQNTVQPRTSERKLSMKHICVYHCSVNLTNQSSHQISYPRWKHLQFIFNVVSAAVFLTAAGVQNSHSILLTFCSPHHTAAADLAFQPPPTPHNHVSFCHKAGSGENSSWNRREKKWGRTFEQTSERAAVF